ncbi:hypothetical protein D8674_005911 [Pyrus ussuriensis x Pyrus communis]|uniref:Uncharacterized protein n=1 Tax=Pyrus ussuriensis x Pyrus communis TaxID=2448454 RepID=A0A5N5G6H3_9ROSA|nr:hypothetical protein D8674_005911 [Pyrus ussuriensis x Pyrus communis]
MSNLIRSCKAVMTAPYSPPLAQPSAATAPTEMDHMSVDPVGPGVSQALASSASSVVLIVSIRRGHRHPRTPDTPSASTNDASESQQDKDIDVFSDVYVRPGDELAKFLHARIMEKRQLVLSKSAS